MLIRDIVARLDELSKTDGFVSPDTPVDEGETVIGTLSDEMKPLWALREEVGSRLNAQKKKITDRVDEVEGDLEKIPETEGNGLIMQAEALENEFGLVNECFWNSLRNEFPEPVMGIGLRKDWQVVSIKPKPQRSTIAMGIVLPGGLLVPDLFRL